MSLDSLSAPPRAQPIDYETADARNSIPSQPGLPFVSNILDVQDEVPIHAKKRLLDTYGAIVKLIIFGNERLFIGSAELLEELRDDKRFWKTAGDGAASLTTAGGRSGLFGAKSEEEPAWQQAHRTLMPAFGF